MIVSSKAFENGGTIPLKHTGFGEDVSPELTIRDVPDEAKSFAVILDDLDVPWTKEFTHWIAWNIPKVYVIPEGLPKGAEIHEPITACQGIAWGRNCYRGPKQPFFIRNEHRYVFKVYALDCVLELSGDANKKNLLEAMKGHILAEAKLTGKFQRNKGMKTDEG